MDQPAHPAHRRSTHLAWWVIAVSLAIIAFNMIFPKDQVLPTSLAQASRSAGARGIFAFTGQISPNAYGVFMVDVDAGTIWCYECVTIGGVKKLRLVSARSWIFDRYLEDYNVDELSPTDVKDMVEQQRERVGGTESRPTP